MWLAELSTNQGHYGGLRCGPAPWLVARSVADQSANGAFLVPVSPHPFQDERGPFSWLVPRSANRQPPNICRMQNPGPRLVSSPSHRLYRVITEFYGDSFFYGARPGATRPSRRSSFVDCFLSQGLRCRFADGWMVLTTLYSINDIT